MAQRASGALPDGQTNNRSSEDPLYHGIKITQKMAAYSSLPGCEWLFPRVRSAAHVFDFLQQGSLGYGIYVDAAIPDVTGVSAGVEFAEDKLWYWVWTLGYAQR